MEKQDFIIKESAGGIVRNDKNQIVLIRMGDVNAWDFPKGGIKENETVVDAAIREIYEEAGIKNISLVKKIENYKRPAANGNPIMLDIHMFLFTTEQKELKPIEKDSEEAKWVGKDNVIDSLTLTEAKEYFKKIIEEI